MVKSDYKPLQRSPVVNLKFSSLNNSVPPPERSVFFRMERWKKIHMTELNYFLSLLRRNFICPRGGWIKILITTFSSDSYHMHFLTGVLSRICINGRVLICYSNVKSWINPPQRLPWCHVYGQYWKSIVE